VKGNLSPIEVLKGWNHGEITKYVTRTPFLYNTLFFVTMNLDSWNAIPEDLQGVILEATEKFYRETGIGLWDMQNEGAYTWAVDEQGVEFIDLSDEEKALWIEKVMPVQDEFKAAMADLGVEEDVLAVINELADKYNGEFE
jgi:TRAP-type C4-dicarboxylate transport system substrate-binding protein